MRLRAFQREQSEGEGVALEDADKRRCNDRCDTQIVSACTACSGDDLMPKFPPPTRRSPGRTCFPNSGLSECLKTMTGVVSHGGFP